MIKANFENLIETCLVGTIAHPRAAVESGALATASDGRPCAPVVQAGLTLNVQVGDRAFHWAWGERVMPGATLVHPDPAANRALYLLACVGNEATVIDAALEGKDGKLRGQTGVVVGKDAEFGCVIVHFSKRVLERLAVGDRVQIRASGQGIAIPEPQGVAVSNCGPQLFRAINPTEKGGRVRIPVACIIPGKLISPELAAVGGFGCGCEIQTSSPEVVKEYKLENLRLGDLVAIADIDATFGPRWHNGAISVGAVVHGPSGLSGKGVGVVVLFSSAGGLIDPVITRKANIADYLNLA